MSPTCNNPGVETRRGLAFTIGSKSQGRFKVMQEQRNIQQQRPRRWGIVATKTLGLAGGTAVLVLSWLGVTGKWGHAVGEQQPQATTAQMSQGQNLAEIELNIGVVQRFGQKPTDKLLLKPRTPGAKLLLNFEGGDGQPLSLEVPELELSIESKPLETSVMAERLVLSAHRSFENAENNAQEWLKKGLPVEIAQPGRWQVWAKRDVYSTPLLRRLLLMSLQARGEESAFMETDLMEKEPVVSWTIDGYRYHRKVLGISASEGMISVARGKDDRQPNRYPGTLRVQPNAYGSYTLVNKVDLETYLRGVVPHEVGMDPPTASLEAQAILARTYVLKNLHRFDVDGYDLCADTHCQVYKGGDTWDPADRAIAATAGQVLTYNNELVDAVYYSTSGGITAAYEDVWNGIPRPYLRPVLDAAQNVWDLSRDNLADEANFRRFIGMNNGFNEEKTDLFRWRETSSIAEMNQRLKEYLRDKNHPLANFQTIKSLKVANRSAAGRVLQLVVTTDVGTLELEKDEILQGFYAPLSTLFYLEPIYGADQKKLEGYAFVGGGFGHGVGFSQLGSHKLAKLGWTTDRILKFYYPGTEIQPLSSTITLTGKATQPPPSRK